MKKCKILFIYPTYYRVTGLPVGIASLSAVLKEAGHSVKIFETSFYPEIADDNSFEKDQNVTRAKRKISKQIANDDAIKDNKTTIKDDLYSLIKDYSPDIIGFSILEPNYTQSRILAGYIKEEFPEIPLIAGGILPTLAPELLIEDSLFDIISIGEGESSLSELANRIAIGKSYDNINGLWIRKKDRIIKNSQLKLHDVNTLPFPDFSEFDERLFYKPMQGHFYKMINIETSRGCFYNCTYCAAPRLRKIYRENVNDKYNRNMDMEKVIKQIHYQVNKYSPEFIYFSSENFLDLTDADFEMFINEYEKIRLPFWIQTRIETINKDRLSELKRVGLFWMTMGLEHGNENFRKNFLRRRYRNEDFYEKISILSELEIGASINNIFGFPNENRELIFDTINTNRKLLDIHPKLDINIFLFEPYHGCFLHEICVNEGLIDDEFIVTEGTLNETSILNFSKEHKMMLKGLVRTFPLYLRLPEKYWDKIRIAENDNPEGNEMLNELFKLL
ncbi:B12-binding domain-containing radical SAM protein [Methanoplanus limicola]|uniref:Radical SAM domain protein n=1 Tax=Methanoplanus limicola DSM 2279 TaxID=937775 RepID=H1YXD3_9EURY|nr:radical SAM protein [Methanoplanus limicola]EHQ36870.1 Radical SAM domain protein [Methanoplanus limicola DSM 2279]